MDAYATFALRPLYNFRRIDVHSQFRFALSLTLMLAALQACAISNVNTSTNTYAPTPALPSAQTSTLNQVGRLANIRIIDRASGTALPVYEYQGEYWVVGSAGSNYSISMQNRAGPTRTLAVTSVDGINVISGQTAGYQQTGYVLSGLGSYEINGWRKSLQEVAAFTFSSPGNSYASKTGRAANVGVIGIALFVEQQERVLMHRPRHDKAESDRSEAETLNSPAPAKEVPAPSAPAARAEAGAASDRMRSAESAKAQGTLAPGLGTQHGQREVSVTQNVAFKRASPSPDEVIMIRYDSLENMVRRGVLAYAQPLPINPPTAMAFPQSAGFVADPPRR
jgi:hypothetical protein